MKIYSYSQDTDCLLLFHHRLYLYFRLYLYWQWCSLPHPWKALITSFLFIFFTAQSQLCPGPLTVPLLNIFLSSIPLPALAFHLHNCPSSSAIITPAFSPSLGFQPTNRPHAPSHDFHTSHLFTQVMWYDVTLYHSFVPSLALSPWPPVSGTSLGKSCTLDKSHCLPTVYLNRLYHGIHFNIMTIVFHDVLNKQSLYMSLIIHSYSYSRNLILQDSNLTSLFFLNI